jgi:cell wall-associated NlpC family hydrolase
VSIITGLATATAVLGVSVVGADPQPTLEEVREQVDALHADAAEANERHNMAIEDLAEAQREQDRAESRVERQTARFDELTAEVGSIAAAAYRGSGVEPAVQALVTGDVSQYLADASTLDAFTSVQSQRLDVLARERISLEQAQLMAAEQERRLESIESMLRTEQGTVEQLLAEQENLLARLTAEQQAEMRRQEDRQRAAAFADRSEATFRLSDADGGAVPASERAVAAIDVALAKVGNGYAYGANGPDVFDCSGLTSWAYANAGVSLPRSSSAQFSAGTSVSSSALAPGDLLFYGSPISHVAMYIGDGMVVHASNPRTGVTTAAAMDAGGPHKPFVGARRPG